jgi:flagellar motor switch protein FliN
MTEESAPVTESAPDSKTESKPDSKAAVFVQAWADGFSQVLAQMSGAAFPCQLLAESPADLAAAGANDLWPLVTCGGGLRGEMRLRLAPATVVTLAQTFMSEPIAPEAELTGDHRETLLELLRQVGGIAASAVKARWGEVQVGIELAATAPSWPPAETFWVQAGGAGPARVVLEFGLSAALSAELRAEKSEARKEKETVETAKTAEPSDSMVASAAAIRPLGVLVDVQLVVNMRFGARRLTLREVLDLSPGSVIELDRRVQEPVDLLLDGRLIARGEVVVIDGSYGLRVTDVSLLDQPVSSHAG